LFFLQAVNTTAKIIATKEIFFFIKF
jgi:hypothetical protein